MSPYRDLLKKEFSNIDSDFESYVEGNYLFEKKSISLEK